MRETPLEASSRYVHGIIWPATKETVLEAMQRNGAPEDVLQPLRAANHPRFVAPSDVHMVLRRGVGTPPENPYPYTHPASR